MITEAQLEAWAKLEEGKSDDCIGSLVHEVRRLRGLEKERDELKVTLNCVSLALGRKLGAESDIRDVAIDVRAERDALKVGKGEAYQLGYNTGHNAGYDYATALHGTKSPEIIEVTEQRDLARARLNMVYAAIDAGTPIRISCYPGDDPKELEKLFLETYEIARKAGFEQGKAAQLEAARRHEGYQRKLGELADATKDPGAVFTVRDALVEDIPPQEQKFHHFIITWQGRTGPTAPLASGEDHELSLSLRHGASYIAGVARDGTVTVLKNLHVPGASQRRARDCLCEPESTTCDWGDPGGHCRAGEKPPGGAP